MHETDAHIDALAVAYLLSQGQRQTAIADRLRISQATVSRYLKIGERFLRREKPRFLSELLPESTFRKVQQRAAPSELGPLVGRLARKHGHAEPKVHIVDVGALDPQSPDYVVAFARATAPIVAELLKRVDGPVGVAWGNLLWQLTHALQDFTRGIPLRDRNPAEIVPLCGDPLIVPSSVQDAVDRTSSRIASDLSKVVNGDAIRSAWLGLVPAYVPRNIGRFSIKNPAVIHDAIGAMLPQYRRIFGPPKNTALAGNLRMILTACGPADRPSTFGHSPLLGLARAQSRKLAESICGDVGGVLIPRPKQPKDTPTPRAGLLKEVTDRWTGLQMGHLEQCARQRALASDGSRPGVVLLGYRLDRVDVVVQAIRLGLVSELILGTQLAGEVERKTASVAPAQRSDRETSSQG
jgi:hypothetical protein